MQQNKDKNTINMLPNNAAPLTPNKNKINKKAKAKTHKKKHRKANCGAPALIRQCRRSTPTSSTRCRLFVRHFYPHRKYLPKPVVVLGPWVSPPSHSSPARLLNHNGLPIRILPLAVAGLSAELGKVVGHAAAAHILIGVRPLRRPVLRSLGESRRVPRIGGAGAGRRRAGRDRPRERRGCGAD